MEMDMPNELERILIFEQLRRAAEATYAKNPLDAENLTGWGRVLLKLSVFQNVTESKKMIRDAIEKLDEALVVDPKKHDAMWSLGNAYTANAFLIPEIDDAKVYLDKASQYFEKACEIEPENELYMKSLDIASKSPEIHVELQQQGLAQQAAAAVPDPLPSSMSTSSTKPQSTKKNKSSDLKYDIFGWIILAVGIVAWIGLAKSKLPPPPPPL